ncbi:hypothetical protein EDB89DRAFT_1906384 [Lactarius sanguifluus]|nr:hypothetical protein EDB89DRAFT_1906384 [Lactarius sanguifluus]
MACGLVNLPTCGGCTRLYKVSQPCTTHDKQPVKILMAQCIILHNLILRLKEGTFDIEFHEHLYEAGGQHMPVHYGASEGEDNEDELWWAHQQVETEVYTVGWNKVPDSVQGRGLTAHRGAGTYTSSRKMYRKSTDSTV